MRRLPEVRERPGSDPSGESAVRDLGLPRRLLDERSDPDLRMMFGRLASRSTALDAAVARIRLAGIDLTPRELDGVERLRVLVAQINAQTLRSDAEAMLLDSTKRSNVRHLLELMKAGRIHVRAAPLAGWAPDFTIFRRRRVPWAVLVGLHWFVRPYPHRGPALTSLHGARGAKRAADRFAALWSDGHDIGPAVLDLLVKARSRSSR